MSFNMERTPRKRSEKFGKKILRMDKATFEELLVKVFQLMYLVGACATS